MQLVTQHSRNHYWCYDPDLLPAIDSHYFTPRYWQERDLVTGKEFGRGTTWFVRHDSNQWVLRHYLRGGLVGRLNRDRYLFSHWENCRSVNEVRILQTMRAQSLPVPRPVAAQVIRHRMHYRADIIIERIDKARDLLQVLKTAKAESFYLQLGELIARFHQAGVFHADLNIQNILQDDQGDFWLIDFDRARILEQDRRWQHKTLKRLLRSFRKEKERAGIAWKESDWLALIEGYEAFNTSALPPRDKD